MESKTRRSRRSVIDEEVRSNVSRKSVDERLIEAIEASSLKNVPLEERRKEAMKPLFLTRYE
jgi:hypothetical protein